MADVVWAIRTSDRYTDVALTRYRCISIPCLFALPCPVPFFTYTFVNTHMWQFNQLIKFQSITQPYIGINTETCYTIGYFPKCKIRKILLTHWWPQNYSMIVVTCRCIMMRDVEVLTVNNRRTKPKVILFQMFYISQYSPYLNDTKYNFTKDPPLYIYDIISCSL